MQVRGLWAAAVAALWCLSTAALAVEGPTAAPISGSDIRTAQLPPPGLYGGLASVYGVARHFYDGNGQEVPAKSGIDIARAYGAAFLLYVPDAQVFGGRVGLIGALRVGDVCGRLVAATPKNCTAGLGDPYVAMSWSRFFGGDHPSRFAGAPPVSEGLWLSFGFGAILPFGEYDATGAATYGTTVGHNVWTFAPTVAVTYTTPPLIADGTEFSARLYWNNYLANPTTNYTTGSALRIDFAVSELIGRVQAGVAGTYGFQIEDDKVSGVSVAPDGLRAEGLSLGPVLAVTLPGVGVLKVRGQVQLIAHNMSRSYGAGITFARKLWSPKP